MAMINNAINVVSYTKRLVDLKSKLDELYSDDIPNIKELRIEKKIETISKYFFDPFFEYSRINMEGHAHQVVETLYNNCDNTSQVTSPSELFDSLCSLPPIFRNEIISQSSIQDKTTVEKHIEDGNKEDFILSYKNDESNYNKIAKVCANILLLYPSEESYFVNTIFPKAMESIDSLVESKHYFMSLQMETLEILGFSSENNPIHDLFSNIMNEFPTESNDENEVNNWFYYQFGLLQFAFGAILIMIGYDNCTELEKEIIRLLFFNKSTDEFIDIIRRDEPNFGFADVHIEHDIFKKQTEGDNSEFFGDLHPTMINGGAAKLATLINIMEKYKILPKHTKIQSETLIYRLTGRCRPLMIILPKIKINSQDLDALYYIIRGIVLRTSSSSDVLIYSKIQDFFSGVIFPESVKDIQFNLVDSFVRDLDELYPGVFGEGAPIVLNNKDVQPSYEPIPCVFKIPDDLFDHPENYEANIIARRRLKKKIGKNDIGKLQIILENMAKLNYICSDYSTLHSFFIIISGFAVNKRCDFQPIKIENTRAAEAVCSVVKKLCEKPNYNSLKQDFIIPEGCKIEFKSPNDRNTDIQILLDRYFPNI